ncbi:hypothetical protein OPV22_004576 [Ensete ventricosum]|uniref:NADH:ubiquinone reductase (non-electrogenic) n=1 Tax=Ensete ventricosum TaxID=4639 RepID=A0AAV8RM30_ENSVE|nr:hypothetical protein OPV22_004576 [Ensete ventricosum]
MAWLRSLPRFSCCPPSIRFLSTFSGASATAAGLGPTAPGAQKPRVVVLGTGWAGCRLMKGIDTRLYDVVCISPRNHMVFTPLLASTCVGTLEFRSVAEPVSRIQPAISTAPGSYFFLARCTGVDADGHAVHCETVTDGGVRDTLELLEIGRSILEDEKRRLLHCVVVGGGPMGVEFSGELSDFIKRDVHQRYSHVQDYIRANEILSSFDVRLREYATKQLTKQGVRLVRGIVKDVEPENIILNDGSEVPYGLLVWIGVDEWLRVPSVQDVFAIGDCSGFLESTGKPTPPALAQVAEREGKYVARLLNGIAKAGGGYANTAANIRLGDPFVYRHLGSMATVGRYKALVDLRQNKDARGISLAGFVSWLIWRSAYLTRVISWRNRFYVAINWLTTFVFGRDISRI